jgi:hypothetical protein
MFGIEKYIQNAVDHNHYLCPGMVSGQVLSLIDRNSLSQTDKIVKHCMDYMLCHYKIDAELSGSYIYDTSTIYMFRLISLQLCKEVMEEFMNEYPIRDTIKYMVKNYSIIDDGRADKFVEIINQKLKVLSIESRENQMISKINSMIDIKLNARGTRKDNKESQEKSDSVPSKNATENETIMNLLVDFA